MSESVLTDHHDTTELSTTLPIQQDESSTDGDDFVGVRTDNTNETPANNTTQNGFGTTSRKESASSKRSVCRNFSLDFEYKFSSSHLHQVMTNEVNYLMKLVLMLIVIIEKSQLYLDVHHVVNHQ